MESTATPEVSLRRRIYLTIMNSVNFEEAAHKLLKIKLDPGQEIEVCIELLECCSQATTYLPYFGQLGQRLCQTNINNQHSFNKCFAHYYSILHRLETNRLRNVAMFFVHLLATDALPWWHLFAHISLTEEDTTSSSRIFIKILLQELSKHLGIPLLNERLSAFDSVFPKDNPKDTRFVINFLTSIGLGGLTENLRDHLKNMPHQQKAVSEFDSSSSSDSDWSEL